MHRRFGRGTEGHRRVQRGHGGDTEGVQRGCGGGMEGCLSMVTIGCP